MLGSPAPAPASVYTETTPASPTRPSRLRGLSYLRNYTHNHLHLAASRPESQPSTRSSSSQGSQSQYPAPASPAEQARPTETAAAAATIHHSAESGWIPTIQGRSGLSREAAHPTTTSTEAASSEPSGNGVMTRSRAVSALSPPAPTSTDLQPSASHDSTPNSSMAQPGAGTSANREQSANLPTIRFIPHIEQRQSRPSLHFTAVSRTLKTSDGIVRVGRYSERDNLASDPPVGFKSKVVSRRHCEFWCTDGQWYIKDVKSSSGTFLNHVRLSSPGSESRPFPVHDGDVVQLGIDFKGGEEVIFRCVKIRIECNRGWQKALNSFNTSAHKRLLRNALKPSKRDSDAASVNSSECSICLNPVAPCQALFVAPCSHVWHYKCIRNLIQGPHYPNFLCPNCRFVADLEADVDEPEMFDDDEEDNVLAVEEAEAKASGENSAQSNKGEPANTNGAVEGLSARAPDNGTWSEAELAERLEQTSLRDGEPSGPAESSTSAAAQVPSAVNGSTQPMNINQPPRSTDAPINDHVGGRSPTPTSTAQFALSVGHVAEGPMTPRNDAGPFILDGSAGRILNGNSPAHPSTQDNSDSGSSDHR